MKKLALLILTCVTFTSVFAQTRNVTLVMNQKLDGMPFAFNQAIPHGTDGYMYKLTRLQYYVSGIQIIHDGGQTTSVADLYLLVNPAKNSRFELGSHAVSQVEGIRFSIGVDASRNHADPSTYPAGHPLASQSPDMHWGWTAGYRFVALEGAAGSTAGTLNKIFQIHALGDELYTPVSVTTSAKTEGENVVLTLDAEYANVLKAIDVSKGVVNHGATGEPALMMQNFKTQVFSPGTTSDVTIETSSPIAALHAYPNPATDGITIATALPDNTPLALTDMMGRTVVFGTVTNGHATLSTSGLPVGSYTVVAAENHKLHRVRVSVAP